MPALNNGEVTYDFGLEPHARLLRTRTGESWWLFDATFSGGGSGTLTRYAVVRKDAHGIGNILPPLALTNQSELEVIDQPSLSPYPLIATADFIWAAGESHFSRHRYDVNVWEYDPAGMQFKSALRYSTNRK